MERTSPKSLNLFLLAGAFLIGTAIAIPIVYILSCAFVVTGQPLFWGTTTTTALLAIVSIRYRRRLRLSFSFEEEVFLLFACSFSSWLMFKTFRGDASGLLFVGSNNIFDFGHALGLIRSFSWGDNIPFMSPFQSGLPFFYHFFFNFYVGIWEYFGIPLVFAMNIPSILSFTTLLVVIYSIPKLFGNKSSVGWIAVLLTLTHPTITFWKYIGEKGISLATMKELWQIPTYPYAGPFDGSTISIFMTLNNYINQRHLTFGIALGLILYVIVWKILQNAKKIPLHMIVIIGAFVGAMFYWNMVLFIVITLSIFILFFVYKQVKAGIVFLLLVSVVCASLLIPYIATIKSSLQFINYMVASAMTSGHATWSVWQYLWENLTLLPFVSYVGYITIGKERRAFFPMVVVFVLLCVFAGYQQRGFDQKFLSLFIIPINILAAIGLVWIWNRKSFIVKILSCVLFFVLTISGVVDLLAVKNEFAYPMISSENISVITWIQKKTLKNAIFISYKDMIDPVVLAGRKNYYGFFGNVGWEKRSIQDVQKFYNGDTKAIEESGISYLLVPKWQKSDFPYVVDEIKLRQLYQVVYEDERFLIVKTK